MAHRRVLQQEQRVLSSAQRRVIETQREPSSPGLCSVPGHGEAEPGCLLAPTVAQGPRCSMSAAPRGEEPVYFPWIVFSWSL